MLPRLFKKKTYFHSSSWATLASPRWRRLSVGLELLPLRARDSRDPSDVSTHADTSQLVAAGLIILTTTTSWRKSEAPLGKGGWDKTPSHFGT